MNEENGASNMYILMGPKKRESFLNLLYRIGPLDRDLLPGQDTKDRLPGAEQQILDEKDLLLPDAGLPIPDAGLPIPDADVPLSDASLPLPNAGLPDQDQELAAETNQV